MKKRIIINNILLYVLVLFLSVAIFSTKWALSKFAFLSFDETIFQLATPIKSTGGTILISYLTDSLLYGVICSIIVFMMLNTIFSYLSSDNPEAHIKLFGKESKIIIKKVYLKKILKLFIIVSSIIICYGCLDKIGFITYVKNQSKSSSFIEENYVDAKKVNLIFPSEKKNLIYIFVESLETTYFSKELGGSTDVNLLEPLTEITSSNINFSDTQKFGGAMPTPGTTWTTSAMIAQTSGIPFLITTDFYKNPKASTKMSGVTALGDILSDNGYSQTLIIGSDKDFGNRGIYFEGHGNYDVYDYYSAIESNKINSNYHVWWGYEDSKLFDIAKEKLTNISENNQPFNFTILTANTHFPDGYLESTCTKKYDIPYYNSINCSATELREFVSWVKNQDFYDNTTIIIVGDHVSMQSKIYREDTNRRIYNVFINSSVKEGKFNNRKFSTMDLFPTTLASLGVEIEGDRLGLGTNLFSDKKTLLEEYGKEEFNKEISKYSKFYVDNILNEKIN